jgi:hypothetical protein
MFHMLNTSLNWIVAELSVEDASKVCDFTCALVGLPHLLFNDFKNCAEISVELP